MAVVRNQAEQNGGLTPKLTDACSESSGQARTCVCRRYYWCSTAPPMQREMAEPFGPSGNFRLPLFRQLSLLTSGVILSVAIEKLQKIFATSEIVSLFTYFDENPMVLVMLPFAAISDHNFPKKMPAGAIPAGTCSYYLYSYCTGELNNLNQSAAPRPAAAPQQSTGQSLQTCCRTPATVALWFRHRSGAGWAVRSGGPCARRYLRR